MSVGVLYEEFVGMEIKRLDTPSNVQRVKAPIQKVGRQFRRHRDEESGGGTAGDGGNGGNHCIIVIRAVFNCLLTIL